MCSVTRDNFQQLLPQITNSIKSAVFIAIDCEFSGLVAKDEYKNSLFDTNDERYLKLRNSMEHFIPIQLGLTTFHYDRDGNEYLGHSYTFATTPRAFGGLDPRFMFQASSIQFLCDYNFDFNKLFYTGISFLSRQDELRLREKIANTSIRQFLQATMRIDDERLLNEECTKIINWASDVNVNDEYIVEIVKSPELIYVLTKDLINRSGTVWPYQENGQLKVRKVNSREDMTPDSKTAEEELLDAILGITKVFRLLIDVKKPIVGHNLLLDLMLLYSKFIGELPLSYQIFKKRIHEMFPVIYDTKYLSNELQRSLPKNLMWSSNALNSLYKYFRDERGRHVMLNSPAISLAHGFSCEGEGAFHEAGWDSYCTGYCFIRMAHIFVGQHYETTTPRIITSKEHMAIIRKFKNCINIIRAKGSYLKLDGEDPISERPPWLFVASNDRKVDISQVTSLFGKYGSVDVKRLRTNCALVAVPNHRCARDILRNFRTHEDFTVTSYNVLRHSPAAKLCLWSGIVLSGGVLSWMAYRLLQ